MRARPHRIEGYAIVSQEGMIADKDGKFPSAIANDADYAFFHESLDRVDACVHGRHSHEGGPHADRRARLVVTRDIPALGPAPDHPSSFFWNPAGASFSEAWRALAIPNGVLAVIGGTDVFGLFLTIGYDAFYLSRAPGRVGQGRPVFPGVPTRTPEDLLAETGLKPLSARVLDEAAGVTVTKWSR